MEEQTPGVFFTIEDDQETVIYTSSFISNEVYQWKCQLPPLSSSSSSPSFIRFKFFLSSHHIFWFFQDISLPLVSEDRGLMYLEAFDQEDATTFTISLVHVEPKHIHQILTRDQHKIVCALQTYHPSTASMQSKHYYLGRAQHIETTTTYAPRDRTYAWELKMEVSQAFPGLFTKQPEFWEQHQEQHEDMMQIKAFNHPPLSARKSQTRRFIPDNDTYSNPIYSPPIHIAPDQNVALRFYNLFNHQHSFIELYLRRANFTSLYAPTPEPKLSPKRRMESIKLGTLRHEMAKGLYVYIDYWISGHQDIIITRITLSAQNYLKTLLFETSTPKTV